MKSLIFCFSIVCLIGSPLRAEPATQPSASLELRAYEEFNRGNFAAALPMLQRVAKQMTDSGNTSRIGSIQESIRVCEKNLKTSSATPAANQPVTGENRKPHPDPTPGETIDLSIQNLGNFDYDADAGGNIPEDVMRLHGAAVRLRGYMIPMDQADAITQFALVPDLFACCLGQPPTVQHTIVVHVVGGKSVSYYPDEIVVEGKLIVEEKKEDGFIVSIFEMETSKVRSAEK